jgi:hypothetical protein
MGANTGKLNPQIPQHMQTPQLQLNWNVVRDNVIIMHQQEAGYLDPVARFITRENADGIL